MIRERPAELYGLVKRTIRKLLLVGFAGAVVIFALGPWALTWLLGPRWVQAGTFARYLAPMFMIQFVASPIGSTLILLEKQQLQLVWDLARLILVVGSFWLGVRLGISAERAIVIYSVAMGSMYIIQLYMVQKASRHLSEATACSFI